MGQFPQRNDRIKLEAIQIKSKDTKTILSTFWNKMSGQVKDYLNISRAINLSLLNP